MKAVVAGGAGGLGRRLCDDLASRGHDVVVLTRTRRSDIVHRQVEWDGRTVGPWAAELEGSLLVNLAGQLVDCPPTARNIERLRRSRVESTLALVGAARSFAPARWLQMSTLAIYGDAGEGIVDEHHPVADGPPQMPGVAVPWEAAVAGAPTDRLTIMRTGIVLDPGGAAFHRLVRLVRLGLGGRIASGRQWVSWIHIEDFLAAVRFLIDDPALTGVVHVTGPNPVRNEEMMAGLRSVLHRPWSPPTPRPLVRIGARLIGSDPALALTGRRCVPARLLEAGFTFDHPTYRDAVHDLLAPAVGDRPHSEAGPLLGRA